MSDSAKASQLLVDFFAAGTQIKCNKDEVLLRPGDESPGVYLIMSGFIKNYSISPSDEINIHAFKKKGDVVPLLWALGDEPVKFYTETISETVLYRISKDSFVELLEKNPEVLRYFLEKLIRITKHYKDRIGSLEHKYVSHRLIAQLLALSEHFGTSVPDGIAINIPLTHQDIADSINSTRETVSRELNKLEECGLVSNDGQKLTITDVTKLGEELES